MKQESIPNELITTGKLQSYGFAIKEGNKMESTEETWTINYIPEPGSRFTGTLTVDQEKLKFTSIYESSNQTVVKAIFANVSTFVAAGGHTVYRYSNDKEAIVELPLAEIIKVEEKKKMFMKSVHITMKTGEVFIFDYGLLSVKKLIEKINYFIANLMNG